MNKVLSPNWIKILKILSDQQYHDGDAIGQRLQVTRSAVWKMIQKLVLYQVKIDSVKGKGYALQEPLTLLDLTAIKKNIVVDCDDIVIFESVKSTNDYLKSHKYSDTIKVCLAEHQSAGKGRLNRAWHSPFGKNIYLSCRYSFQKDISELSGLSLVTGLAIVKTLKEFGVQEAAVKWPNDILVKGKKISGTLIELQGESHGKSLATIGMGVNVNMLDDDQHAITQVWTSMRKELGDHVDRNMLCAHLLNTLIVYLQQFNTMGLAGFVDEWTQSDCLIQRAIVLKNADQEVRGKVVGINTQGHLLVELCDGTVRSFSSGDTTVLK
jgi:BirA family biotin operon repressor/biotin-[acetyl-CoA-carboxylase] ligase